MRTTVALAHSHVSNWVYVIFVALAYAHIFYWFKQ